MFSLLAFTRSMSWSKWGATPALRPNWSSGDGPPTFWKVEALGAFSAARCEWSEWSNNLISCSIRWSKWFLMRISCSNSKGLKASNWKGSKSTSPRDSVKNIRGLVDMARQKIAQRQCSGPWKPKLSAMYTVYSTDREILNQKTAQEQLIDCTSAWHIPIHLQPTPIAKLGSKYQNTLRYWGPWRLQHELINLARLFWDPEDADDGNHVMKASRCWIMLDHGPLRISAIPEACTFPLDTMTTRFLSSGRISLCACDLWLRINLRCSAWFYRWSNPRENNTYRPQKMKNEWTSWTCRGKLEC